MCNVQEKSYCFAKGEGLILDLRFQKKIFETHIDVESVLSARSCSLANFAHDPPPQSNQTQQNQTRDSKEDAKHERIGKLGRGPVWNGCGVARCHCGRGTNLAGSLST